MSDPLLPLLLALRYMHILGAIALMGSTIFIRFALRPAVGHLTPESKSALHDEVRRRWSRFVMLASALLLISGITNLALAARYDFEPVFGMSYHMVVGIKLLLALPIFFIAAVMTGRSEMAKRFQAQGELWMNVNLTLALLMVLIGGALKFVSRTPKAPKSAETAAVGAAQPLNAIQILPFPSA